MTPSDADGRILLEIARETVEHAVRRTPEPPCRHDPADHPWLFEPGATFVTLRADGRLRGCLGTLEARRPLIEDLRHNAEAVVAKDPRFSPVSRRELSRIRIEVSLLSPLEEVEVGSEAAALDHLARGRDGWWLSYSDRSSTFLPQVWEVLPTPREFLERLREKAGLAPHFWDPDVRLWRYTVRKWCEGESDSDKGTPAD